MIDLNVITSLIRDSGEMRIVAYVEMLEISEYSHETMVDISQGGPGTASYIM